jgi:dienelactone hydrolase
MTKNKIFVIFTLSLMLASCATNPVETEKFTIKTYLQEKPTHTILVIHGSGGVTTHEESWAKTLKESGLNVLILDSYSARGIRSHMGRVLTEFGADDRAREIIKLSEWTKQQPWHKGKIGLLGFSQGGSAILASASPLRMQVMNKISTEEIKSVDFAITYYPGCSIVNPDLKPVFPIQIHLAELDDLAQPWRCYPNTLTDKNYELHFYKDARHTFDWMRSDVRIDGRHFAYHKEADKLSRQRVSDYIKRHTKDSVVE